MEKPKFVYVTLIATTPEKLWTALTSPEFTVQYWFGTRIESDWQVGSPMACHWGDVISDDGVILRSEPPKLLSYTFHPLLDEEMRAEQPSRVTFEIEPLDGVVRLTVTHDDFPPGSKVLRDVCKGWPAILSSLKTLLETGRSLNLGWKE